MSTIEQMNITQVLENKTDWHSIIPMSDPFINAQNGSIILKNAYLPHPKDHFTDLKPSGLTSFPERIGGEFSFKSWRIRDYEGKGFHLHEFKKFYLLHRDTYDPVNLEESLNHLVHDTSTSEKLLLLGGAIGIVKSLSWFAKVLKEAEWDEE